MIDASLDFWVDVKDEEAETLRLFKEELAKLNMKEMYREGEYPCKRCGLPCGSFARSEEFTRICCYCDWELHAMKNKFSTFPLPTHAMPELLKVIDARQKVMRVRLKKLKGKIEKDDLIKVEKNFQPSEI